MMTIGITIDRILLASASLMTWGTIGVSLVLVTVLAIIIKRRNHLTKPRIVSNLAGYIVSATLFVIAGLLAIPANTTSYQWIAYIFWMTLMVCIAILMAALWERFKGGPFPILRGYVASGLLAVAAFIAPVGWAAKEQSRIDSVARSMETINGVIREKRMQGILPEGYPNV